MLDWDGIREIVALVDTFLVVVGNPKGNGGVGDEGVTNSIGFGDSSTVSEDESRSDANQSRVVQDSVYLVVPSPPSQERSIVEPGMSSEENSLVNWILG